MKQRLTWMVTLVAMLIVLVSCGPTTTPAPKPTELATPPTRGQPRTQTQFTSGTVANIFGGTLILTTAQGQVTVTVAPNTSIQKTVAGTFTDLQEGQSLAVTGRQSADGTIVATSITIRPQSRSPGTQSAEPTSRPPPPPAGPSRGSARTADGTLTNIVSNTLTLATPQGKVSVTVGSNASILKTVAGDPSDLQEGESLTVIGSRDANGNIAATSIIIRPPRPGAP